MIPDFRSPPPPDIRVQVEGLRRAFPLYRFTVVVTGRPTDPRYIEVRRRNDPGGVAHWLLISSDARKIWHELRKEPVAPTTPPQSRNVTTEGRPRPTWPTAPSPPGHGRNFPDR